VSDVGHGSAARCDTGAVIVTHDNAATIAACLVSLRDQVAEVVVVDSASTDGTADIAEAAGVRVVRTPNRGFGAGCNAGARLLRTEALLLLNPDAVLGAGAVGEMLEARRALEATGRAAAVGPLFDGEDFSRKESYLVWRTSIGLAVRKILPARRARELVAGGRRLLAVPRLSGACMLMRLDVFHRLGGFDEDFFLYFEDVDLSLRARRHGVLLAVAPDAGVRHCSGSSASRLPGIDVIRCRSALRLARKHHGRVGRAVVALDLVVTAILGAALEAVRGRPAAARRRLSRLRALRPEPGPDRRSPTRRRARRAARWRTSRARRRPRT
jgi:GT2 family glycosyltransferase